MAHDADAGVTRDEHQEACLPLGESARDDGADGVIEIHRNNSSASLDRECDDLSYQCLR